MHRLAPVQTTQREIFMDVLRGFAILGIFIANLNGFSWYNGSAKATGPYLLPGADNTMSFLHQMFIEGKFYSIFSLLFGWGIALQFKRAEEKGINALPTVRRRLFFMLLLGAVHLLLWPGDIVFFYAILAFVLLPLRKLSNKTLLITGCLLVLSPILLYWLKMTWPVLNYPADLAIKTATKVESSLFTIKSEQDFLNIMKHGNSWFEQVQMNVVGFFYRYNYLFFVSRIPKVLGIFLIGYVIGRSDFYKNILQHKKIVYWAIGIGLVVGLPANYFLAYYMSNHGGDYWQLKTKGFYQTIFYALGVAPLAMAYVGLFMLSFQKVAGKKVLSVFAPVGKMAFSNYILQTLIGSFVFLGPGLGYFGEVGPVYYTIFGVVVFIFQIILSTIWLKFFNYGPVEWIWRSATYKKWQPFLKK
ncbi:MAG: DUF418 domain-containing protein [Chitinophagaceae bacterium]|nr:DUF418 domain-containing protein [Chitinophagaceae bacterium]MBK8309493.1 DUF418 domain-containing protein [Chitinophagaceae bacterium]MBP6478812.1 DUF418 domain-containing protein [Chitinophagaceae bacterium]MBP7109477.1 DUF418 domain-containing protein [Chitinophagaceae bacterium]MBP7316073.1 DUF418 domain-containing protein [Chitinophagaceae bacterium]